VKKTMYLACAFALALATWTLGRAGAASRCYPNERFAVLSGGLVSDNLTNLVWQQQASPTTMTWAAAQTYCPSGSRLPTVKELLSIVDLTVAYPGPTIDQTAFPSTPASGFWTSSPYAWSPPQYAWLVAFKDGSMNITGAWPPYYVRCVR
jgi:Protein of unknown function (DUF1566)